MPKLYLRNHPTLDFNSIKVQLRRGLFRLHCQRRKQFQFHKGTIKTQENEIAENIYDISIP